MLIAIIIISAALLIQFRMIWVLHERVDTMEQRWIRHITKADE